MQAGRGKASRQPTQGLTSSFDALGWQESVTRQMELPHPPPSYPLSSRTGSGNGMAEHMAPQSDPQPISLMRAARRTGMALQRTRVSVDRTSSSLISFGFTSYQVCAEPRQAPVSGRRLDAKRPPFGQLGPPAASRAPAAAKTSGDRISARRTRGFGREIPGLAA